MTSPDFRRLFETTGIFDANTIESYLSSANLPFLRPLPTFFSDSCLAYEDDIYLPSTRPPVPSPGEYIIPRRKILDEDALIVERAKEDRICFLFRQDGYQTRAGLYQFQRKWKSLRYLRLWRMVNQHIPELYISEGTRGFEVPEDALLAAIVEDVDLGDEN